MTRSFLRRSSAVVLVALVASLGNLSPVAGRDDPVTTGVKAVWERTDSPQVRGARTFVWGPAPIVPALQEPLAGLPGDHRLVVYWDKARMEVNDPAAPMGQWFVTNGLLVREMVTGQQQIGANPDRFAARPPAEVPFGDLDDPAGPTFRSFAGHLADAPLAPGQPVAQAIDRDGRVSPTDAGGVACAVLVETTRHCIAAPFTDFLESAGDLYVNGQVTRGRLFDPPYYATGLPLTEAYWITVLAAGTPTRVLIQLFERRTLTYNPANPVESRVEMGNVGLEYYHWRYDAVLPTDQTGGLDPALRGAIGDIWDAGAQYRPLMTNLTGGRYQLIPQDLTQLGAYSFTDNQYHVVVLEEGLLNAAPRNLARVLAHGAQQAYDFTSSGLPGNAAECYAVELRGLLVEAAIWQHWYGPGGVAAPADDFARNGNAILTLIRSDPDRFVQRLLVAAAPECGPPGGDAGRFLTTQGLPASIADELPVERVFAALRAALVAHGLQVAARSSEVLLP